MLFASQSQRRGQELLAEPCGMSLRDQELGECVGSWVLCSFVELAVAVIEMASKTYIMKNSDMLFNAKMQKRSISINVLQCDIYVRTNCPVTVFDLRHFTATPFLYRRKRSPPCGETWKLNVP